LSCFPTVFKGLLFPNSVRANEGIEKYYIRYDVKSSKNAISDEKLTMIPAKNEFRAEKFSRASVSGAITAANSEPAADISQQIKEDALKQVLVKRGLKSVIVKDLDTVISYEGAIHSPVTIVSTRFEAQKKQYQYTAQIEFSPIAFPDQWESMGVKHRIKTFFSDFFQLFR
jgi:hypothetical protein